MLHTVTIKAFSFRSSASKTVALVGLFAAGLATTGCATMVNGPRQVVVVSSIPAGATVCVDGQQAGTTPCQLALERKRSHSLQFSKAGYQDATASIAHKWSGVGLGNILVGGLIGASVDAFTGSDYRLEPSMVEVMLRPETADAEAATPSSYLSPSKTPSVALATGDNSRSQSVPEKPGSDSR